MLSDSQIEYALANDKRIDKCADAAGETIACAHHTERGVFVLIRDAVTMDIFHNESFYIEYKLLAALNARQWPGIFIHAQNVIYKVESYPGTSYEGRSDKRINRVVWRGNSTIARDAPGVDDWLDMVFGSKK